jgi:hypothetical protein
MHIHQDLLLLGGIYFEETFRLPFFPNVLSGGATPSVTNELDCK